MKKYTFISITSIAALLLILHFIFQFEYSSSEVEADEPILSNETRATRAHSLLKSYSQTVSIGAIGDILIHSRVYNDAATDHGYDFAPMIQHIKHKLLEPDILLANQESLLGGSEIGVSTYPSFNSPQEVGDAFIDAGVDIFSTANNHTLDRGVQAIENAIQYYNQKEIPYVGHFQDKEDQNTLRILEKNGISFAFLSYTYGTNGIPVPEGKEYLVNIIEFDKMKEEVTRAKAAADIVVMSIHWGNEYERYPTDEQKLLAIDLANIGVDVIIGHHPHVLQPFDWIYTSDGRKAFVVYSLGNFISGQKDNYKDIGGIATIRVTKTVNKDGSKIELSNPEFHPTYVTSQNDVNYQVVPLTEASRYGLQEDVNINIEIMDHMYQWINE